MIAIGHKPEGGTVSDIQSLTQTVRDFSHSIDFWNQLMLWGLAFTVIAALSVLVATRMVVFRSGQLSATQELLGAAKDRQLQAELGAKDVEIGKLKLRSDTAESAIATAQADAAKANLLAEQEKLARVKLEKQIQPRAIDQSAREQISEELKKFAPTLKGRKVKISSQIGNAEGMVFSLEIMDILTRAGIEVDAAGMGAIIEAHIVTMGVITTGPTSDQEFIRSLVGALNTKLDPSLGTSVYGEWKPEYTEILVMVGVKPIAGLSKEWLRLKP